MRPVLLSLALVACTPPEEGLVADPADPTSFAEAVDADRYTADLTALAVVREPGSAGWQAAQDRCAEVFEAAGFATTARDYGSGVNVLGRKTGTVGGDTVVISAHYDSVPGCEGADDNASGVAGVLEAARVLSEGTFDHDLVVACWDEEESGLTGSRTWAEGAADRGEIVQLAWSLEMIGYTSDAPNSQTLPTGFDILFPDVAAELDANQWRGDFIAFIGDEDSAPARDAFRDHAGDDLPVIDLLLSDEQVLSPLLGDLQRSDHASFWRQEYSATMITDTSNFRYAGYHCGDGPDTVDRLDLDFAAATTRAVVGASAELLVPSQP